MIAEELEEYNNWEGLAGNMNINSDLIKENCATSIVPAGCHRRRLVRSYCDESGLSPYQVAAYIANILESMKNKRIAQKLLQLNFTRGEFFCRI